MRGLKEEAAAIQVVMMPLMSQLNAGGLFGALGGMGMGMGDMGDMMMDPSMFQGMDPSMFDPEMMSQMMDPHFLQQFG